MKPLHKLLIGTWRSDRRRTLSTCHKYHCLRGEKKRRFAGFFGKLELRYTAKFVFSKLRDFQYRSAYDVIAEDADSIVIRIHGDGLKKRIDSFLFEGLEGLFEPRLQQITFRRYRGRQYYSIGVVTFCEWFQKRGIR